MYLVTREKVEAGTRLAFDTEWEPGQTKDPLAHSIGVDLVLHANGVTGWHAEAAVERQVKSSGESRKMCVDLVRDGFK